ncbi:M-phase phosphoprotein 6-like [Centruroides sculpturatus]|uniref:M-phase phosphoprotein 6-like n=1 Tax=Centruroides sculpturatus TaxID=218467 RepID=UPI000C6DF3CA|nr:M-phase phosphoprotein 6-like [Centruroides sculpturatus]
MFYLVYVILNLKMYESQESKTNLSKNLLKMKFMKRSKEKIEQKQEELEKKALFETELIDLLKKEGKRFLIEPSYAPCEQLVFGRMSFKGMNPEIEKLMLEKQEVPLSQKRKMGGISDKEFAERKFITFG